jgi:hypothetical protein
MGNFYTDVISKDPRFDSMPRISGLDLLEDSTRQRVQGVIADAKETLGIELMIFETFRSQARQQQLFDRGVTQLRQVGVHHFGLACDIVKVVNDEPSWKGDFSFLNGLARKHGLIWGGNWGTPNLPHTFVDAVHVQRCSISRQAALLRGDWYPTENYDPYGDL